MDFFWPLTVQTIIELKTALLCKYPNVLNLLGHLKTTDFPFGTNGKVMVLGVPILIKNTRVIKHNICILVSIV